MVGTLLNINRNKLLRNKTNKRYSNYSQTRSFETHDGPELNNFLQYPMKHWKIHSTVDIDWTTFDDFLD